ncbi:glycosyltransferase family 2 protein [Sphingobacteriales bacterium UPWRP_1]|nr:dTDP-Rha--alpha-D-GlcNAc-pyrophosphate polyprenol alpha-3-L-rhamnosyltransferase [Sphingobacteriales bacterium TSM_CSS]PSJ77573.1 glycosyltransferase family 2 protein [Sphingobacteriales bacterium UPWRP_1]
MKQPLVSIITVNYNQPVLTCELLASVKKLQYQNYEVIVVDNGSKVNMPDIIKRNYPDVQLICSNTNLGFAGGNNLGIKAAHGEYLFLVNNDVELNPNVLDKLLPVFEQYKNAGVVCPKICYHLSAASKDGKPLIQYVGYTPVNPYTARNSTIGEYEPDQGQYNKITQTPYAHGAAMLISRTAIEKTGLMPENYFLYYEELDWCEQIRRMGFSIWVEPEATVYHKESMSVGKTNPLKTYFLTRNRILFMRRNASTWQLIVFLLFFTFVTLPKNIVLYIVKRQYTHLRSFLQGVFWHLGVKKNKLYHVNPA